MLHKWKSQLPPEVIISHSPTFLDTACYTLHMAQAQLIVLTTRPIFLAAVKQAVAEQFMGGQWSIEKHVHGAYIQACSGAAHRNLTLAQRIRSSRKLLQAGLHFVFNAAVILLLDRIIHGTQMHPVGPGQAVPPPLSKELHSSEIQFAIYVFEQESQTGTNYPRDCCKVLQDLKALVDHYLSQSRASCPKKKIDGRGHDSSTMQSRLDPSSGAQISPAVPSEDNDLYQELVTWVQGDDLPLRSNSLLI